MHFAVSMGELERSFLAGFLEGEATLSLGELNGGQSVSCAMDLKQRDDEQDTLEWLLAMTGLGRLRPGTRDVQAADRMGRGRAGRLPRAARNDRAVRSTAAARQSSTSGGAPSGSGPSPKAMNAGRSCSG